MFQKGNPGKPKGSKNKVSFDVVKSIQGVYGWLGGDVALLEWAKSNPEEFYKIVAKLIPKEIKLEGSMQVTFKEALIEAALARKKQTESK